MSEREIEANARATGRAWFGEILKPLRPTFRELACVSLFINVLALAQPIFMLQVYDRVVFFSGMSTLAGLAVGMAIAIAFDLLLRTFRSRLVQRMATKIDVQVSRSLFKKLLSLELHELEAKTASFWMTLFRDIDVVRNTASGPSAFLAADLPFALIFVALAFVIAPPIAWVLLVSVGAFFVLTWRSGSVLDRLNSEERKAGIARDTLVAEFANTRTIVKAMALDHAVIPAWEEAQAKAIDHAIVRGSKTDFYTNIGASLSVITSVTMTVFGAIAIVHQDLSVGSLIACNMLSSRILAPLNQLFGTFRSYTLARNSITRLGGIFAIAGERETSEVKLPRPVGRLVVERASYRHVNAEGSAVENVNLTFQPGGGYHVIIGRNGGGKTTLLKLMLGLYRPLGGRVLLDNADIAQFSRFDLRRWIGYVPQDTVLFAGTIRDNIIKGAEDIDDDTIVRAAQLAGLHQGVIDLPKGYATEIGEAGAKLSGGFRQRVVIARALVRDPPVLLLDEPSSHLDRPGEEHLRQSLLELARDHTIVIATHSPVLLEAATTVAMIDRGRVTIAGPSAEVLARLTGRPQPVPTPTAPAAAVGS